ncbi:hypothetical protein SAY87_019061 [Trapa incisa]|uniref:Uncharacterized protein n=1 Tax=Trapa incisa TaxID=236973 RepID=A0AAN7Q6N8_9MYRT|nr:hypothetical protein SAY87_019061 [Trapa incisa]
MDPAVQKVATTATTSRCTESQVGSLALNHFSAHSPCSIKFLLPTRERERHNENLRHIRSKIVKLRFASR